MSESLNSQSASVLRALWFRYLDTVASSRPLLHRYCLRLTGSIFDAEDLLQETLLRGFGAIGRGDFPSERVPDARAYLCRIATNAWIDEQRKRSRARRLSDDSEEMSRETSPITRAAGAALFD